MTNLTLVRWALIALLISTLSACAGKAPAPDMQDNPLISRITDPDARRQLQLGNPVAAANIYSRKATRTTDPGMQQDMLLLAAEILFDRGLMEPASEKLAAVPESLASADLAQRRAILVARELLNQGNAEQALSALPPPLEVNSALDRGRIFETRAQAYEQLNDPDNELIARINLQYQLTNPETIKRGQQQIWQLLNSQPENTLRQLTTNVRGDIYQGWIELALLVNDTSDDARRRSTALDDWQQRFFRHPANPGFIETLYDSDNLDFLPAKGSVNQIAVLLPLTGRSTAAVSAAIQNGLIAAYQYTKTESAKPALRFYDVGENTAYARTAYQSAIQNGADAVIGPLRKEAVAAIASQQSIPVPTLTLNTTETFSSRSSASENLMQFSLAPEDEAEAAASRAIALGYKNAVILQTNDNRGDREASAFQNAMFRYGGDILHTAVLPKDEYDYTQQIKAALSIDESDQRFRALSRTIGQQLFFEPSIRSDVDVIFLALTNEQARSARTQLDFFYARDIPRLGTSRIAGVDDDEKKKCRPEHYFLYGCAMGSA